MKKEVISSSVLDNSKSPGEFRCLWLIDSMSEICFQFDIHSDFWIDWDDGDEAEHIVNAQVIGVSERQHGSTRLERVPGDEILLTIHHQYKNRLSAEPVSISINGRITNWKAGSFNYCSYLELKKYIDDDKEPCHLLSIEHFGPVGFGCMAFLNCRELTHLPEREKPDSRYLIDMGGMFYNAIKFNSQLNHWDVSQARNMCAMFYNAREFDQPLNGWNVSNVVNMSKMFCNAWNFDRRLDNWDVSQVTDMSGMFCGAEYFNHPLNCWDVSHVEDMSEMFYDAYDFNQPLSSWNVSNVKNMSGMFSWALRFNRPLNKWNVSNVENMSYMFWEASRFNQPLHKWNVSNVKDINGMFRGAIRFNRSLRQWKLHEGIEMSSAFRDI